MPSRLATWPGAIDVAGTRDQLKLVAAEAAIFPLCHDLHIRRLPDLDWLEEQNVAHGRDLPCFSIANRNSASRDRLVGGKGDLGGDQCLWPGPARRSWRE